MQKTGRNDPCVCGSGKKFKKCCEATMIGGRFKATKVDAQVSSSFQKTVGLTSFFQSQLAATPKKPASGENSEPAQNFEQQKEGIC
jgi:hypothetical protein